VNFALFTGGGCGCGAVPLLPGGIGAARGGNLKGGGTTAPAPALLSLPVGDFGVKESCGAEVEDSIVFNGGFFGAVLGGRGAVLGTIVLVVTSLEVEFSGVGLLNLEYKGGAGTVGILLSLLLIGVKFDDVEAAGLLVCGMTGEEGEC